MRKIGLVLSIISLKIQLILAFQQPINEGSEWQRLNQKTASYIEKNDWQAAENTATEALSLAQASQSVVGKATALDNLGTIARARFDYTNAMNYFVEALKLKESLSDKSGLAASKNHIGKVFHLQNNHNQALANYQAALTLLGTDKNNLPLIAETHRNLGDVYLSQKYYGKAIQEFDEALRIWSQDLQDFQKSASLASFLGKVNFDIKDNDGAINNFNASLNFHKMLNEPLGTANDLLSLSRVYNELNDTELAVENAEIALSTFTQINHPIGIAEANWELGNIYLKNNDKQTASTFFEKSGYILKGLAFQPTMPALYRNIAEAYQKMGNTNKAFDYLQLYATSKDSLFDNEKSRALVEMTAKYESEFAVKDKNRQLAALEKDKANELRLRWSLIGLVGLILFALWLTFRNYRLKKQDNEKLAALNMQIQIQNEAISKQNDDLEAANMALQEKNTALDLVNSRLVEEVSERERSQNAHFSKDHYLADVSARMRDPLSILVNEARQLMNEKLSKSQSQNVKNLQFATNNLLVLINDILNFSNIEAGKLTLAHQDFELQNIVEQLKESVKQKENLAFEVKTESHLPEKLKGDPVRFLQILNYLTHCLQRQTNKGHLKLNVACKELKDNEATLKIDILASGDLEKNTFFSQILTEKDSKEYLKELSSEDMELLTARRLVELQNGSIRLSEQTHALHLTLYLPFKRPVPITEVVENTEGVSIWANNNFLEGKRILIVEDNKINQVLVSNMLKKRDVIVSTANDGLEALDALAMSSFDLILMDIQMPRMDGYRAVAEIRRLKNTEKATIPIIALTASAYINEKEKAQLFGMTDHIGKPFSPDELMEKVIRVLMATESSKGEESISMAA
ncbi:MAG: response regulator [Saprospiraceae bacterium]|nr:response regulator [Saprospiraceae bacterium]